MAIGFNLPGIPGQIRGTAEEAGGMPDLQQAIMQGFGGGLQMQYAPKQMAQDFLAKQLANKMAGVQAQYAEPMAEASLQQKMMEQQFYPQLQQAKLGLLEAQKQAALKPSVAEQLLPYQAELLKAKTETARLPRGGKPTTYEQKRLAGSGVLDYLTPVVLKQPYVGTFSSAQVASDLASYKSNPEAKQRLIDYAVAAGLVPEHTSGALSSQGLQTTVDALKHQRQATTQGWPTFYEKQVSSLPKEIQIEAKKEIAKHQQYLKGLQSSGAQEQNASESDPLGIL
jgi:hypothetical protein